MTVRVGINGFGRIGRNFFRAAKRRGVDIDFVAVNDLGALDEMAHLLKYDSVLGVLPNKIKSTRTASPSTAMSPCCPSATGRTRGGSSVSTSSSNRRGFHQPTRCLSPGGGRAVGDGVGAM
jgi:hypothetical protein